MDGLPEEAAATPTRPALMATAAAVMSVFFMAATLVRQRERRR
jgi:hypothetical protein